MESFVEYTGEYKKQMMRGVIPKAYRGLMDYIMNLRTHFAKDCPDLLAPGNIYYGYMDMTYFPVSTKSLKSRKLKIAIVFIHESVRFEAWLAGENKQIQEKYWKLFKESGWNKYRIPSTIKGADSIVETTVVDNPDFGDLDALTKRIEQRTLKFVKDVEDFLGDT